MKYFFVALQFMLWLPCFPQTKTDNFLISSPEARVYNGLYNSIRLVDIRKDTTDFGIIQKGAFNKKVKLVSEVPMSTQFSQLVSELIDSTAKNAELVLLLRQLSFAEVTGAMSERGYFHLRAVSFANNNGRYFKLQTLDTVVVIKSMDVTKKMLRLGNKTVTDFIASSLTMEANDDLFLSLDQLPQIDSFEKSKLPLYTAATYNDGLYYNFQSFVNQQPDETGISITYSKDDKVKKIVYTDKKGKQQEMDYRLIYGFVHNGRPYVAGEFTCYPLEKRENDFYFTGKVNNAKSGDVAMASAFFGIIGGLMASSATATAELKVDHLSGGFIRVRETEK